MNSLLRELTAMKFGEYQALRDQLMEILTDADLGYRPGGATETLGALCRDMGDVERSYVDSFRTFRQELGDRNPDPRMESSVEALSAWYTELDRELVAALEGLSEDDIAHRRIVRSDFDVDYFSPLPRSQIDTYREALLIFYGKVSVYLRAMDKPFPPQWQTWIG